jgi:hypothetical protein
VVVQNSAVLCSQIRSTTKLNIPNHTALESTPLHRAFCSTCFAHPRQRHLCARTWPPRYSAQPIYRHPGSPGHGSWARGTTTTSSSSSLLSSERRSTWSKRRWWGLAPSSTSTAATSEQRPALARRSRVVPRPGSGTYSAPTSMVRPTLMAVAAPLTPCR